MTSRTEAAPRRRGAALEAALLAATWTELAEVGYADLTFEGVAARAQTSRMVLYRRWPDRAHLVLAATRRHVTSLTEDIPDTGVLRDDVLTVLRALVEHYRRMSPATIHGLLAELPGLPCDVLQIVPEVMATILVRAADRGEVRPGSLAPRIASLPADLLRHEILLCRKPIADTTLVEIVDDVFLPLVRIG